MDLWEALSPSCDVHSSLSGLSVFSPSVTLGFFVIWHSQSLWQGLHSGDIGCISDWMFRSGSDFGFDSIKWLNATTPPHSFTGLPSMVLPLPLYVTAQLQQPCKVLLNIQPGPGQLAVGKAEWHLRTRPDPMATSVSSDGHCKSGLPGPGTMAGAGSEDGAAGENVWQGKIYLLLAKQTRKWCWLSSLKSPQLALCAEPGLTDPCGFSRKKIWHGKKNEIGFR